PAPAAHRAHPRPLPGAPGTPARGRRPDPPPGPPLAWRPRPVGVRPWPLTPPTPPLPARPPFPPGEGGEKKERGDRRRSRPSTRTDTDGHGRGAVRARPCSSVFVCVRPCPSRSVGPLRSLRKGFFF